jgi:AraC family ethanolamine operon transcriptional activator
MSIEPVRNLEFVDADEAAAAVSGIDLRITVLAGAVRPWQILEADLGPALLTWGKMGSEMNVLATVSPESLSISMMTSPGDACTVNGHSFMDKLAFLPQGSDNICSTNAPIDWIKLQFNPGDFDREFESFSGQHYSVPRDVALLHPPGERLASYRTALLEVATLAKNQPELLADPSVRENAGKTLLGELFQALAPPRRVEHVAFSRLAAKLKEALEPTSPGQSAVLHPSDLCKILGVNDRSLRRLFADIYGTSPARYLRVRRLHQARRALQHDLSAQTITEVGIRYGFFDLGRFAGNYRDLFGESPSETLRGRHAQDSSGA